MTSSSITPVPPEKRRSAQRGPGFQTSNTRNDESGHEPERRVQAAGSPSSGVRASSCPTTSSITIRLSSSRPKARSASSAAQIPAASSVTSDAA
jgi:hypothetical protein